MKKLIGFLLVTLMSGAVHAQYNTKVYMQQGGAKQVVLSGGEIEVRSGGLVDIQSGATMTNAATVTNSGAQTFTGNVIMGAVGYKSTHTASNGNWAITGNVVSAGAVQGATLTGTTSIAGGAISGTTLSMSGAGAILGAVEIGAEGTQSTMTAAGVATFHTSVTAPAITGSTSVSGAKVSVTAGPLTLYSRTQAQIEAFTPAAVGEVYFCNDCTATSVCVSSAAAVMSWVSVVNPTTACD